MPPENLYGLPRPATKDSNKNKNTPSSSTLAFTTKLSSLIASPSTSQQQQHTPARPRPRSTNTTNSKDDIFARPNRGTAQRAAADERGGNEQGRKRSALEQVHSTDSGLVDEATLERSKRRLREKEGLYEILREGGHLVYSDDEDSSEGEGEGGNEEEKKRRRLLRRLRRKEREGLVDFDAKWAETKGSSSGSSSEEDNDGEDDEEEEEDDNASVISYEDELGRTRHGTRKQAARAAATIASTSNNKSRPPPSERWKPTQPANLIHGSTIQTQAFDPDAPTASQMARLAARRDRSATPPEETHYDAAAEVRARGTGFYAFSRDEAVRRGQMEELLRGREETVRGREERRVKRERRGVKREERRRVVGELRGRRRAEVFLEGLS